MAYEASSALSQCSDFCPNLLLTDVIMPGMDGIELSERVVAQIPNCKVLLVSGNAATAELLERAQKKGRKLQLLPKPVHPVELLRKIADMLDSPDLRQIA